MKKTICILLSLLLCMGLLSGCGEDNAALIADIEAVFTQCVEYHNGTVGLITTGSEVGVSFNQELVESVDNQAAALQSLETMIRNGELENESAESLEALKADLEASLEILINANDQLAQTLADAGYEVTAE